MDGGVINDNIYIHVTNSNAWVSGSLFLQPFGRPCNECDSTDSDSELEPCKKVAIVGQFDVSIPALKPWSGRMADGVIF